MKTVIKNAKIYTPRGIRHSVTIEEDKITGFDDSGQAEREIDAQGKAVVA